MILFILAVCLVEDEKHIFMECPMVSQDVWDECQIPTDQSVHTKQPDLAFWGPNNTTQASHSNKVLSRLLMFW